MECSGCTDLPCQSLFAPDVAIGVVPSENITLRIRLTGVMINRQVYRLLKVWARINRNIGRYSPNRFHTSHLHSPAYLKVLADDVQGCVATITSLPMPRSAGEGGRDTPLEAAGGGDASGERDYRHTWVELRGMAIKQLGFLSLMPRTHAPCQSLPISGLGGLWPELNSHLRQPQSCEPTLYTHTRRPVVTSRHKVRELLLPAIIRLCGWRLDG